MGISRLQRFCDKWCEWSEKELRHQVQYLYTTAGWTLKFTYCGENWEDLWEAIYADAGECGKSDEDGKPGRAISGYLIVLEGHNGTFLPLAWLSKRHSRGPYWQLSGALLAKFLGIPGIGPGLYWPKCWAFLATARPP